MAKPKAPLPSAETPVITQPNYIALSIAPTAHPREFLLIEHLMSPTHEVLSTKVSPPYALYYAIYEQKRRGASCWTGAKS